MTKTETMQKYEIMFIVDAKLSNDDKDSILKGVTDLIVKSGGKIINSQVWQERFKLTVKINKCQEGTYYLINFESEPNVPEAIKPSIRLNEKILRYLVTVVEEEKS